MDPDLVVLSPEKTILTYRLAGLGVRIRAHLLDLMIVLIAIILVAMAIMYTLARIDPQLATGVAIFVCTFAIPIFYFILFEGLWNGQTPGKKLLNLRVRMSDGTPIRFGASLARNLLRPADALPGTYFFGLLAMFTTPKSQRLGDLVAGTVVIYEKRPEARFALAPHSVGIHPFEAQVGELRGMTAEEYQALRRFADRFPELSADVQNKLLAEVWRPIAERRKVPTLSHVHPVYLMEAVVMKYGRRNGML